MFSMFFSFEKKKAKIEANQNVMCVIFQFALKPFRPELIGLDGARSPFSKRYSYDDVKTYFLFKDISAMCLIFVMEFSLKSGSLFRTRQTKQDFMVN